jgi:hypothetical protein
MNINLFISHIIFMSSLAIVFYCLSKCSVVHVSELRKTRRIFPEKKKPFEEASAP